MATPKDISLGQFIEAVKQELIKETDTDGSPDIFKVEEVLIEASFTVSGSFESGINLKVLKIGASHKEENIQKVTLKLTPIVDLDALANERLSDNRTHAEVRVDSKKALFKGGGNKQDSLDRER